MIFNYRGITNIKKGTSGKSWFFEQQTYSKESKKTRSLKAGSGSGNIPKNLFCSFLASLSEGILCSVLPIRIYLQGTDSCFLK